MKSRLRDFTNVDTIYRREIRTVRVRLRRTYVGSKDIELLTVNTPADVHAIFRAVYAGLDDDQEHFVMLVSNGAGQVVGYKLIGSGAQDHVYVDCKIVFRNALLLGAHSIIVAHNHPSGSLVPSAGDLELTGRLVIAGKVLEIPLLDHFILGHHADYVSLYEKHPALFGAAGDGARDERDGFGVSG
jgi:DNA repair protein RadC